MIWSFNQKPREQRQRLSSLKTLDAEIMSAIERYVGLLQNESIDPDVAKRLEIDVIRLSEARVRLACHQRVTSPASACLPDTLAAVVKTLLDAIQEKPAHAAMERLLLAKLLVSLLTGQVSIGAPAVQNPSARRIILPADVVFQAHSILFPAERMLVAGGYREGESIRISTLFDVTGEANSGHVLSNPEKLAQSLSLMSNAGAHLALWWHSHPGSGHGATHPSSTDRRQFAEWLQSYSASLLGIISVKDGCFRLWGTAIETNHVQVDVIGKGLKKENSHEHLYRVLA